MAQPSGQGKPVPCLSLRWCSLVTSGSLQKGMLLCNMREYLPAASTPAGGNLGWEQDFETGETWIQILLCEPRPMLGCV